MSSTHTSVKAAPLPASRCPRRQKLSSFPSTATFNLFRKKRPSRPSLPVEPYEVARGIWNMDTTARVFGYLDTDKKRVSLTRVRSAGSTSQAPSQKAKRNVVEQYNTDPIRDKVEDPTRFMQERRYEQRIKRKSTRSAARHGRMGTVSKDDQLVERGANPRTGLVSPFVISDDSEESRGNDYIGVGNIESAGQSGRRRAPNGKWKQDSLGWSLVESPLLSPNTQKMSDTTSRVVSLAQLEDRLLVQMPFVDTADLEYMTDEQIKAYQEEIARLHRNAGGSITMLDPNQLPSPRQWTPEGLKTSDTQYKTQRKEVGSGAAHKSDSDDTVVVNTGYRANSLSTRRKDFVKRQEVRILTPSNTPNGSPLESCANASKKTRKTDPFLGLGSRMTCGQTPSATLTQSCLNNGQAHQRLQDKLDSDQSTTSSDLPLACPALSQHIPRLQYLRSSHSASPKTSSYCHTTQLLPVRLRPGARQGQVGEDVCPTTFTTTSTKGPRWEQRPKLQRQEGNSLVPRVAHPLPISETTQNGCQVNFRDKTACTSAPSLETLRPAELATGRSRKMGPPENADPARDLAGTRHQMNGSTPAACLRPPPCEDWWSDRVNPTHVDPRLSLVSANIARERIQRKQSGDCCTTTYAFHGNESRAIPGGKTHPLADYKEYSDQPAELTIGDDCSAWFAGQWAEVEEGSEHLDLTTPTREQTLAPRRSVTSETVDVKSWLYAADAGLDHLAELSVIQEFLHGMICHIRRTLHSASPILTTLATANATTRDRIRAMRDLALAAAYLFVLLNIVMLLKGMLVFVGKALYWACHPLQMILVILG